LIAALLSRGFKPRREKRFFGGVKRFAGGVKRVPTRYTAESGKRRLSGGKGYMPAGWSPAGAFS